MPKSKKTAKPVAATSFFNKKDLKRFGIALSVLANVVVAVALVVAWADWHNGDLNVLTGDMEQSTCQNLFQKEATSYIPNGTPISVGNVKFVPFYLTAHDSNSTCQYFNQADVVNEVARINNSAATNYFYSLYNLKPLPGNAKVNVPLYYNNTTKQLSSISPLVPAE